MVEILFGFMNQKQIEMDPIVKGGENVFCFLFLGWNRKRKEIYIFQRVFPFLIEKVLEILFVLLF